MTEFIKHTLNISSEENVVKENILINSNQTNEIEQIKLSTDFLDIFRCLSAEKQLDKGQDYTKILSGIDIETCEKWTGGFLADGHGFKDDLFMTIIKNIDYVPLLSHIDPIPFIRSKINEMTKYCYVNSGMTFILVKIYENRIVTYSIGDSSLYIFINDILVYKNIHHSIDNELEMKRLEGKIIKTNTNKPILLSKNKITMDESKYINFIEGDFKLAITQSLGHHDYTGIVPEIFEVSFSTEDKIRIVAGSDGYFDMHNNLDECDMNDLKKLSLTELINKAESRWKQDWEYCPNKNDLEDFIITKFPGYDDISILLIEN
jgi:hypothetical protein